MFTYGLTGGIGSGKTTVGAMFQQRGVPVFIADDIGRELLNPGTELSRVVLEKFPRCSSESGQIDRKKLGQLVFADESARQWLEEVLHPAILVEFLARQKRLTKIQGHYCLLEGAVLLESKTHYPLAGLIVVVASAAQRLNRLRERDGLDDLQIQARFQAQLSQDAKILRADYLIDNNGTLAETEKQVDRIAELLSHELGENP